MRKLLAPIAGTAIAALLLAACGGGGSSSETTTGSTSPTTGSTSEPTTEAPSGDPIAVGVLAPLTGPVALDAERIVNIAQMQVDKANAEGGINGRPLELKVYDTKLEPETAATEAQRAITQDGVVAMIGPYATSTALAAAEVSEREGVLMMSYAAATPAITEGKKFAFRVAPLTPDLGAGQIGMAVSLGAESAVLLHDSGGFGLGAVPVIEAAAQAAGLPLEVIEYPINASDVSAQVTAARATNAGAVLIAGSAGADYGLIAKAMAEQGFLVPLIGFSPITVPDAVKIAGEAYTQLPGVYTLQTIDPTKPEYQAFIAEYNANFEPVEQLNEQPTQAYDAINWIIEALRTVPAVTGADVASTLETLPGRVGAAGAAGSQQQFTVDSHDAYKGQYLVPYKVVDGKAVPDPNVNLG